MPREKQPTIEQHYISQVYLRGFSSNRKTVCKYSIKEGASHKMDENKEFNDFMNELFKKMIEIKDKYNKLSPENQYKVAQVCRTTLAAQGIIISAEAIINGIRNYKN